MNPHREVLMSRLVMLLVVLLSASAFADPGIAEGISLTRSTAKRHASLLAGKTLTSSILPSVTPPLHLMDGSRFDLQSVPRPLDEGGGIDTEGRQVLALVLGLLVGFGLGHLVARDRNGFILFLVIDLAIVAISEVLGLAIWHGFWFWPFGLALLVSHVIQGIDAYAQAGGGRLVDWTRERSMEIASNPTQPGEAPLLSFRAMRVSF